MTTYSPPETELTGAKVAAALNLRQPVAGGETPEERGTALLDQALELVNEALEGAFRRIPVASYDEWLLTVAQAIGDRRKAPGNAQTTGAEDTAGARAPRDPLAGIRPQLDRYVARFA